MPGHHGRMPATIVAPWPLREGSGEGNVRKIGLATLRPENAYFVSFRATRSEASQDALAPCAVEEDDSHVKVLVIRAELSSQRYSDAALLGLTIGRGYAASIISWSMEN